MLLRKISKQNIIEILLLPIIFVIIFLAGVFALVQLNINNYLAYASWCLITGIIVILIVGFITYRLLRADDWAPQVLPPFYGSNYSSEQIQNLHCTAKRKNNNLKHDPRRKRNK
jgi:hypothetical protein